MDKEAQETNRGIGSFNKGNRSRPTARLMEMVDRAVRVNTEEDCKVQSEHCKLGIDLA